MSISPDDPAMLDPATPTGIALLSQIAQSDNVCDLLEDNQLKTIGQRCVSEYKIDLESRSDWQEGVEAGLKLAKQVKEEKSFPWPNAANVKYPLLAEAAISFAARAYPELVKGKVVKAAVVGKDHDGRKARRAERIGDFMSWQVLTDMPYWDAETDSLLVQLPLIGNVFRKTYHDPVKGTCESRLVPAMDFVVNHNIKCLENARRESEYFEFYGNDVLERQRSGKWRDTPLNPDSKEGIPQEDKLYKFIEQHRWLDLDEDGYEEPYIVTVHMDSGTVMRIVPRFESRDVLLNAKNEVVKITAARYYTHYTFMPNPDGGLYAIGLCMLLLPVSESINTVLNQLLDAGTMANTSCGFLGKGIRIKGGTMGFGPNEWKFVDTVGGDLKNNIAPLPVREPSNVLFQLLGLLIESGKSLANLKDVLAGELPQGNTPATTVLAMIEQGQKVFNAIYKRVYRALGTEFEAIFRENRKYLSEEKYRSVLDDPEASLQDFVGEDYDVVPVADPNVSSQVQRMARAQALMPLRGDPGMKGDEVTKEYIEAIGCEADRFFDPQQQAQEKGKMMALAQVAAEQDLAVKAEQMNKVRAEIKLAHANAIKALADAEQTGATAHAAIVQGTITALDAALSALSEQDNGNPRAGRVAGMAGPSGDQMVPGGGGNGALGAPIPGGPGQNPALIQ